MKYIIMEKFILKYRIIKFYYYVNNIKIKKIGGILCWLH